MVVQLSESVFSGLAPPARARPRAFGAVPRSFPRPCLAASCAGCRGCFAPRPAGGAYSLSRVPNRVKSPKSSPIGCACSLPPLGRLALCPALPCVRPSLRARLRRGWLAACGGRPFGRLVGSPRAPRAAVQPRGLRSPARWPLCLRPRFSPPRQAIARACGQSVAANGLCASPAAICAPLAPPPSSVARFRPSRPLSRPLFVK